MPPGDPDKAEPPAVFEIRTPAAPGAVAVIRLDLANEHTDPGTIGCEAPPVGRLGLRHIFGIDHALVARPDAATLLVMPHGGAAVVRSIVERLVASGCVPTEGSIGCDLAIVSDPADADEIEARMLETLARAPSPLAVDLLLDQPRRWEALAAGRPSPDDLANARVLGRLVTPPTVVAIGRPNIGKSSLLNAIGGQSLALAFDRSGTTRDAVGAMIDAGGLVVRWIDTPGLPEHAPSDAPTDEHRLAARALADVALIVSCHDAGSEALDPRAVAPIDDEVPVLHVTTRADRLAPGDDGEAGVVRTSVVDGSGLGELVSAVREALVPASVFADPRPWRFWSGVGGG